MGERAQTFPPVVYAPVIETPEDPGVQRLKGHVMADGRTALFVYSAVDRLVTLYGDHVPWVLVTVESLQSAFDEVPYDLVFLDQALHPSEDSTQDAVR
jgi:hypothetical protein